MATVRPGVVQSVLQYPGTADATYGNVSITGDATTAWADVSAASYAEHTFLKSAQGVSQPENWAGAVFPATVLEPGQISVEVTFAAMGSQVGGVAFWLRGTRAATRDAGLGQYYGAVLLYWPVANPNLVFTQTWVLDDTYLASYGMNGAATRGEFEALLAAGAWGFATTPFQSGGVVLEDAVRVHEVSLIVPDAPPPPPPDPEPVAVEDLLESRRRFT